MPPYHCTNDWFGNGHERIFWPVRRGGWESFLETWQRECFLRSLDLTMKKRWLKLPMSSRDHGGKKPTYWTIAGKKDKKTPITDNVLEPLNKLTFRHMGEVKFPYCDSWNWVLSGHFDFSICILSYYNIQSFRLRYRKNNYKVFRGITNVLSGKLRSQELWKIGCAEGDFSLRAFPGLGYLYFQIWWPCEELCVESKLRIL